jgi:hypothetical protein
VVPRCYLRGFATDEKVELHVVGKRGTSTTSIENVCVRRAFYSRTRPRDGERIDDVEAALARLEAKVAPYLRSVEAEWPLTRDAKAALAEFFGVQLLRSPAWRNWYDNHNRATFAEARERGGMIVNGEFSPATKSELDDMEEWFRTDTQRLSRMLSLNPKAMTLLGSMRWDVVSFGAPILATSDHPLVTWPITGEAREPGPTSFAWGLGNLLEVAIPVSGTAAVLMTWGDGRDHQAPVTTRRPSTPLSLRRQRNNGFTGLK